MSIIIVSITLIAALLAVARRRRMQLLAASVNKWALPCCLLGSVAQVTGLRLGGQIGHFLIALGGGALVVAALALRRWPGGWLVIGGVSSNALAMAVHGRMPITPEVLAAVGSSADLGTKLTGKDIVAQGWIAHWLGDYIIVSLPAGLSTIIYSPGDIMMLLGLMLAMFLPLRSLAAQAEPSVQA